MESKGDFISAVTRTYPAWFGAMRDESPNFFYEVIAPMSEINGVTMTHLDYTGTHDSLDAIVTRVIADIQRGGEIVLAAKTTGLTLTLFRRVFERLFVRRPDLQMCIVKHGHNQIWLQTATSSAPVKISAIARHTRRGQWFGMSPDSLYVVDNQ